MTRCQNYCLADVIWMKHVVMALVRHYCHQIHYECGSAQFPVVNYVVMALVGHYCHQIHYECGSAQSPVVHNVAGPMPQRGNQPGPVR